MSQKTSPFNLRQTWALWAGLALVGLLTLGLGVTVLARNAGHLTYVLDDAYIHLAMARSLAQYGVWGATPYAFSSSSSSPLWTGGLALLMHLIGNFPTLPFWLNLGLSVILIVLIYGYWVQHGLSQPQVALALVLLILAMPLLPMIFNGMEHILHTILTLAFLLALERALLSSAPRSTYLSLLALALLLPLVRYEGLFLIAVTAAVLTWQRRWRLGLALVGSALLPITLLGLWFVQQGWWFLPVTLLIKGAPGTGQNPLDLLRALGVRLGHNLGHAPQMGLLLLGLGISLWSGWRRERRLEGENTLLLIVAVATLIHLMLASVQGFARYQAYLVASAIVVLTPPLMRLDLRRWFSTPWLAGLAHSLVVALILAVPVLAGAYFTLAVPRASANIYQQQYQIARFVGRFYPQGTVALNDIGAVAYFTNAHIIDLVGLATRDIAQARLGGTLDAPTIDWITRQAGADLAIVYDAWFPGQLPSHWYKVGEWEIPDNLVCGDATVSFYALREQDIPTLRAHLRAFAPQLPPQVQQRGTYLRP
ncbi:hypothetical protein [uncultured Thermanaerothrix sp.]|uniref:hypothetical protein n=1 Tax=uncultured Thermanaerothrix sp. TaxID=1195149 RepID=UPI002609D690|nr:hypothetical protein [uncultured Thermanaerothrix sp.]